jgi:hypothetical protein
VAKLSLELKNPEKYAGDIKKMTFRSSWEVIFASALDTSPAVSKWVSEPKTLNIRYRNPFTQQSSVYWPDFLVQYVDGSIELIEIKPAKEALGMKAKNTYDKLSLIRNACKWAAAAEFAKKIGARFRVVTEAELFGRKQ